MRFLTDQNVYLITIKWLRSMEHDVLTARELGLESATDEMILAKACKDDLVLLTRDKDFGTLVFFKGDRSQGVILLRGRFSEFEDVHRSLKRMLEEQDPDKVKKCFCVIEPKQYRMRDLRIPHSEGPRSTR